MSLKLNLFLFFSSGPSCCTRITKLLSKNYPTLSAAEEALGIDYLNEQPTSVGITSTPKCQSTPETSLSPAFCFSPKTSNDQRVGDAITNFLCVFRESRSNRMEQVLAYLFKLIILEEHVMDFFKFVKRDFISMSIGAMKTLFDAGKHNSVSALCKCFEQVNSNRTRMPLDRMPYGLIDYNIQFFANKFTQKLGMEEHYVAWTETMFAFFGHKWIALHSFYPSHS